jgi:hypothetical protein
VAIASAKESGLDRPRLLAARTANAAWEVIEGEETPNYNHLFEGDEPVESARA